MEFVPMPAGTAEVWTPSAVYYRLTDWLGSSRFASTTSRTMYYDGAYAPFGEPYAQTGTSDLSFTGMNQDTVSALYDFPAREYGIQGRWPSPDPAGLLAVDPSTPQSWNRYAYVLNSPLIFTDPTGMDDSGRTQDPYCDYVECDEGGMPNYSPPPDDGLQFIMDPIRVTTAVCISCLYSDWLDFMYFTSTVGNPPPQSQTPTWWLQTKVFVSTLGSNFADEFTPRGCFVQFVDELADGKPQSPAGAGLDDAARGYSQAAAGAYAVTHLLSYPLKSSVYRGILAGGEKAAGSIGLAPFIYSELSAGAHELQSLKAGTCK